MENFTPVSAALGGALIGLSVLILWLGDGRIAGISGAVGGLIRPQAGEVAWRPAFLGGLLGAPLAYSLLLGTPEIIIRSAYPTLVVAGLLVGFGSRLGSGCTSGHGVAGIARLSRRSITATGLFMLAAAVTVFIARHVVGD
ncbi:YeeE/YedE thiosulfate transporter family protein [Paeniroseomonas aquatica]|uniref:YeeE/YedE thiosulfate transporter family protein n=1 Tax=Paeniroseomonas aquatica TaxID=373043 RepID=A0ABT8A3E4_9PROT|nr:YeeE/YedE thiosulfate transporter family protein [Paeniroseomonas aquatica]MDN3564277.1 YeeE/YedE thiosulfate transporter family protein [Paeniroseomonas aquatica]